jgi:uncharacterized protein (DUF488 family)
MVMKRDAMVAQQQLQSQQIAAESAMQQIQAETQSKIQIKQAEISFEIEKLNKEAELKSYLMREEFDYSMQVKGLQEMAINERDTEKEKAKDKRISIQNTQQSKLINQRKNNLPPMDFESNEDSLDGFDMAEFEPR